MSIFTFIIGALLSAVGALSMYYGYGIVEVERGWTEVISGTVALVGGMLIMMLALVLRALHELRPLTAGARVAVAPPPRREAAVDMPQSAAFTPPVPIPAVPLPPLPDTTFAPAMDAAARDVEAALFGAPEAHPEMQEEPAPPSLPVQPPPLPVRPPRLPIAADPFPPVPPPLPVPALEEAPSVADPWHDLDRELARLDQEDVGFAPATAPATIEPMSAAPIDYVPEPEQEPAAAPEALEPPDPAFAAGEPHQEPDHEPHEEPVAPVPEPPAVIGRYQADGTSYVMYADGTIEAHGTDGTLHFSSMTELKAFIEAKV